MFIFKQKTKKQSWITLALVVVGLIAVLLLLDKFIFRNSDAKSSNKISSNSILKEVKKEAKCSCGCDLTLENCEKFDPNCTTRPELIAGVQKMIDNNWSKQEILVGLNQISGEVELIDDISENDDPVKGLDDAPVTIIEFSDFQCPYCASFYSQTMQQLEDEYIKTGKAKLVFRDFPLSFHENAQKAAEAAECADEQGKFWEYHDLLFERQSEWSNIGITKFKEYAQELGLNTKTFNQCLDSGEMASEVKKDLQDGKSYGISGTPAFLINGELLVGAQPFSVFKQKIDKILECESGDLPPGTCSAEL